MEDIACLNKTGNWNPLPSKVFTVHFDVGVAP